MGLPSNYRALRLRKASRDLPLDDTLRATFCNHGESPDNLNFFESLIISSKLPFDELFLKTTLKTIYFFENLRKTDHAPESRFSSVSLHESPTSQNSPEKLNSIPITHKAISIFLLHMRHYICTNDNFSRPLKLPLWNAETD